MKSKSKPRPKPKSLLSKPLGGGGHAPRVFDEREFGFDFDFYFDFEMFCTLQIVRFVVYRTLQNDRTLQLVEAWDMDRFIGDAFALIVFQCFLNKHQTCSDRGT